jgi:hypothetical protein
MQEALRKNRIPIHRSVLDLFEPLGEQLVPSSMLWIVFLLGVIAMPFVLLDLLAITRVSKDC